MSEFPSNRPRSKLPIVVVLILIVIAAVAGSAYYLGPLNPAPQITVPPTSTSWAWRSRSRSPTWDRLEICHGDAVPRRTERSLASEQYDKPVSETKIAVALTKVSGKGRSRRLRVTARDASRWHFFSGNEAVLEKNLTIDLTPPTLELIADDRYVNFGGVGTIVYKALRTRDSGVKFGDYFPLPAR
jgi:hypothetical protein